MTTASPVLSARLESDVASCEGLRVRRLTGRERISQPFELALDVVTSGGAGLPPELVPGAAMCLVLESDGHEVRRVHGMLGPIRSELGADADDVHHLVLAPRALRLASVEMQEVFLDVSVPEVVTRKLKRFGLGKHDVEQRLLARYPKRDIVVQFAESDLAFVSRLTEQLGVSFFFEHESGRDKLVLTDHAAGFRAVEGAEEAVFRGRGERAGVYALDVTTTAIPATYFEQDYNYRTPGLEPTGQHALADAGVGGIVEWGAHVKTPDEAAALARIRAEERVAGRRVYRGASTCPTFSAGRRVALLDHPKLATREELLLVAVEHEAVFALPGAHADEPPRYTNRFEAIPADVVYRPARRTPRPRMHGVVTGVVQPGPEGEVGGVARLDAEGRYTVQLHFDVGSNDGRRASHPVRMAQPFGGQGNSMHLPLLPGTEVLVAFANGDPDRPVLVGALPNPTSPSTIVDAEAHTHRIRSSQGVVIEFGATVLR